MANIPIIRQIAWIALVPQLLFMGFLMIIYYLFNIKEFIFYGAITYLLISFLLRNLIPRNHRKGIKYIKQLGFEKAINEFEKSIDFFSRNKWIDKYRYLVLLNASKMSFREMGLCNIAFCYGQTGNVQQAEKYYNLILEEFPDNGIALAGIRMITSIKNTITASPGNSLHIES